jgi:hypothetical protein
MGNLYTGEYTDSSGTNVNLLTGDMDGGGNIYANDPNQIPNTSTMNVPPQFTASGVGSAIPISSLGNTDFTLTDYDFIGTSTRAAITIEATTIPATMIDGTAVPEIPMAGTTIPATTITGTAVPPQPTTKTSSATSKSLSATHAFVLFAPFLFSSVAGALEEACLFIAAGFVE